MRRLTALRAWLDARRFAGRRADYFAYLHAVLSGTQGQLTIRELFARDARRHGVRSTRGRLAHRWAQACDASGGDLHLTWRGCFPADELNLVRAAQAYGNARLLHCFGALAEHLGLLIRAQRLLWGTLGSAAAALLLAQALLVMLPLWTAPALQQAFAGLPSAYYGPWARGLFALAGWLARWGWFVPAGLLTVVVLVLASLPRAHGPMRWWLDRWGPWRLYRQTQSLRILVLLSILVHAGEHRADPLRPAVQLLGVGARPWLGARLHQVLRRIDQGHNGAAALHTGLLDRDVYWYLEDVALARGLPAALQAVHHRLAGWWLDRVRVQAVALRWGILLLALAFILAVTLWHYAAIDDLRRGWMMFQASQ